MKQKKINIFQRFGKYLLLLFIISYCSPDLHSQYKFRYDNDYLTTLTLGPENKNGFRISVSLVALFTAGSSDRSGIRIGGGINLSQTVDNWTFSVGLDAYKAKQKFGLGTSYAGITFDDGYYGATYYLNWYHQGDKQVSGLISLHLDDFRINFEDDILAYPFVGFKVYDRFRTGALEIRYKEFMVGTNVYTSDMDGRTDMSPDNILGIYHTGKQVSSPIYVGYSTHNLIMRLGLNNKTGGLVGQNSWHRYLFNTPDFKPGDFNNLFFQLGVDKPYTLY